MKFVQNNKILVDSNAEEAQRRPSWLLLLCAWLCVSALKVAFLFGSGFAGLGSDVPDTY